MENEKTFSDWLFDKTGLSFWCVWPEFFNINGYNWITFDFIQLEFEFDKLCGECTLTFQLLGVGFRWAVRYKPVEDTEVGKDLIKTLSHTKECKKKEALSVLSRIQSGEHLSSLILEYENMDTTIKL